MGLCNSADEMDANSPVKRKIGQTGVAFRNMIEIDQEKDKKRHNKDKGKLTSILRNSE